MDLRYKLSSNILLSFCLWLFLVPIVTAEDNIEKIPPLRESDEIHIDEIAADKGFDPVQFRLSTGLSQYKDIYVNPLTWSAEHQGNESEIIYQLSVKVRLFDMNLYYGYTQKSFWQAFNTGDSAPFRETNYNPEIFYRIPPGTSLLKDLGLDIGIEHESNGQSLPFSRSWNRVTLTPHYMRAHDLFYAKLWYRIPEDEKNSPQDPSGDDNPDIQDYYGYSEVHYVHLSDYLQRFHIMARGNLTTHKGAISLSYDIPSGSKDMYYRLSLWNGYGESLADYNHSITRIGVGVSFYR